MLLFVGALCYAELGTFIDVSGGEYSYLLSAYGPLNKRCGGVLAYLFAWMNIVVIKPSSVAIITLSFGRYAASPFFTLCVASAAVEKCLAAFIIGELISL